MSAAEESERDAMMVCASCGVAGSDDIKLKKCTACHLVRYCSVKCQKEHRPRHKKSCKKRAAELRDEILFKQPESSCFGECPLCCVPLPIDESKSCLYACCSKYICNGCDHANKLREREARLPHTCPFCRKALPKTRAECIARLMKRIEANDPAAMCNLGKDKKVEGDYKAAFEYWTKAVALGDTEAHYHLSILYHNGEGVEKDEKRALYHTEQAAIGGHPEARYNIGCVEGNNGRIDRAAKHWIIGANLGCDGSLERVKTLYKGGDVSKEDFAATLRGHKAAIDATKSPQREEVVAFAKWMRSIEGRGSN